MAVRMLVIEAKFLGPECDFELVALNPLKILNIRPASPESLKQPRLPTILTLEGDGPGNLMIECSSYDFGELVAYANDALGSNVGLCYSTPSKPAGGRTRPHPGEQPWRRESTGYPRGSIASGGIGKGEGRDVGHSAK